MILTAKIKKTGDLIEVVKNKEGFYIHLNSGNKIKKYKKEELIFIG